MKPVAPVTKTVFGLALRPGVKPWRRHVGCADERGAAVAPLWLGSSAAKAPNGSKKVCVVMTCSVISVKTEIIGEKNAVAQSLACVRGQDMRCTQTPLKSVISVITEI